ncbi:MFS transporter [Segniliparus rugosus]|uniref:Putative proline/betaine transporter n=1 Tax=Segniliparus rugosus (strain ATCC BAA-974 / DSM 45345 / CCUG 50838 / CIP 108380 / JCM 13579 / CDC 945) TaxID=679197 RepID=E5XTK2_SEGRC|nr:MFS transporter [Segniliparus rugosus]EFV12317.1 hypothetical protein HMPREF9336_02824 [Segniliparus rugosus ATCC BAA-974]
MGNATEWFDYGVYALTVPYISKVFFPGDGASGTLWALLTFAISFLVRPLGGLVWGPLGDRLGRKQILAATIVMMSGATFCVGLLPTHAAVGAWAPAALILLRMVQGFSTGGEYGGAATFMAEYAPDRKRGFCGSFLEFGTLGGYAFGALLVLLVDLGLDDGAMQTWGWRLPYLIAGPLGLVGLYLRSKMEDTPCFQELEQSGGNESNLGHELHELATVYRQPVVLLFGLVVALNVANYTLLSFMPTYLGSHIGLTDTQGLVIMLVVQLVMMALLPMCGALSDRVGRKPMWRASLVGLFVLAVPMFLVMRLSFLGALVGLIVLGGFFILQLSTISATFPAMFPTQVRFAGFALSYNVATSVFGGTCPLINEWLIDKLGSDLVPAGYLMASCLVGLVALPFVTETAGVSLRGRGVPGVISRPAGRRPGRDRAS